MRYSITCLQVFGHPLFNVSSEYILIISIDRLSLRGKMACHVSTLCCKKGRPDVCKSLFIADLNSANLGLVRFYQTALCKSFFRTNASQDLNSAVLKYFLDTFPHYSRTYYAIFVYLLNHQYLKCCISPHVVLKIFHV